MIKVMVVDDSPVQTELLTQILNSDPEIQVVDTAKDGLEALAKVGRCNPDVITMDIHMPNMDGIEATRKIMATHPVPIVIISGSCSEEEVSTTFQAIEAGAVSVAEKLNYATDNTDELVQTVKTMSEVKVVRRREHLNKRKIQNNINKMNKDKLNISLIAIGVSTGGPIILQEIFNDIIEKFPPILVVQHISAGFLNGLSEWLQQTTNRSVKVASQGEDIKESQIYLAPDGYHMGIDSANKIILSKSKPESGHRPSASFLFRSVAEVHGKRALGILLTGMGTDGAQGLKELRDAGAFTIAQDEESSAIYGMPKEAVELNAVSSILSPKEISNLININCTKI